MKSYLKHMHYNKQINTCHIAIQNITSTTDNGVVVETNLAYERWLQQDQMVLSTILSLLSENVLAQVLLLTTACEVWQALDRMFSSGSSRARVMQI